MTTDPRKTVFAQLTSHLPIRRFHTLVKRYRGGYKVKAFSCLDQLLTMIFAQLAMCDSLRDIEASLSANPKSLYHLGIRSRIRRSTLADANEKRDARIFEKFAKILIVEARKLYAAEKPVPEIGAVVYAFDSTTISLCLELFPWAEFRKGKAGIKWTKQPASSVIKPSASPEPRQAPHIPSGFAASNTGIWRRGIVYEFLSNSFTLSALVIAKLYKQRWQVVLFFKWIKQHLRIKLFFGVSENAVHIQVWTALSAYLLLAIVKQRLSLPQELHEMTQTLRLHLFEKMPVLSMFFEQPPQNNSTSNDKQLALFD